MLPTAPPSVYCDAGSWETISWKRKLLWQKKRPCPSWIFTYCLPQKLNWSQKRYYLAELLFMPLAWDPVLGKCRFHTFSGNFFSKTCWAVASRSVCRVSPSQWRTSTGSNTAHTITTKRKIGRSFIPRNSFRGIEGLPQPTQIYNNDKYNRFLSNPAFIGESTTVLPCLWTCVASRVCRNMPAALPPCLCSEVFPWRRWDAVPSFWKSRFSP